MKIEKNILLKVSESDIVDGELTIPSDVVEIGKNACAQNFSLERVTIPASVKRIDDGAFQECDDLFEVNFECDYLEYLGTSAFRECSRLQQVGLPKVEIMGASAFEKCDNLTYASLNSRVVSENCFSGCDNLMHVDVNADDVIIRDSAFKNCRGLACVNTLSGVGELGEMVFDGCSSLLELTVNERVTTHPLAFENSNIKTLQVTELKQTLTFDYPLQWIRTQYAAMTCEAGEGKQAKQIFYIEMLDKTPVSASEKGLMSKISILKKQSSKKTPEQVEPTIYKFDIDDLNAKIKDFDRVLDNLDVSELVGWLKLVAEEQNISPTEARLPQAEVLLTLSSPDEKREFVRNMGKYNKIAGKYRNLNLRDRTQVLKLCKLLGAFQDSDKQFVQCANCLSKDLPAFIKRISGKDVSTYTGEAFLIADFFKHIKFPKAFSQKRAKFFIDYYKQLLDANKIELLALSINDFDKLSKSINVVTPEKIEKMLVEGMSSDVPENRRELAELMALQGVVGKTKFERMNKIMTEAERVYPNIFDEEEVVKSKKFNRAAATKLVDDSSENFQFEWLEKSNPYNLLIGNICGCCARLGREGEDIMYKSATHPDVQTMAIKRNDGEYIGKATVYLNREDCYAVFNNVELNRNFSARANDDTFNEVLDAFMRGVNAFVDAYNSHAPQPLSVVTVGGDHNKLRQQMVERFSKSGKLYKAIEYKNYKVEGDSGNEQFLVYNANHATDNKENSKTSPTR